MLTVNKNFSNSISVLKNSNKLISSTQDSFAGIRPGTYIKFGNIDVLHSIVGARNFFYSKDFITEASQKLIIKDDTGITLQRDDQIKIIFDEYKLNYILNITNPGRFYNKGEILRVDGGTPSINLMDGNVFLTKFIIEEINPDGGGILKLALDEAGRYLQPPTGAVTLSGGKGDGAIIEPVYTVIDNRNIQDRVIKDIEVRNNQTYLTLDYPLPSMVKQGKLSLEKWEVELSSPYSGDTQLNIEYKLFRDFTANYNFPLTVKNNPESHLIYNQFVSQIDIIVHRQSVEIDNLKKIIKKLEV
jgi:hypothetical protein